MIRALWMRWRQAGVEQERARIQRLIDEVIREVRTARIPPNAKTDVVLALLTVRWRVNDEDDPHA